LSLKIRPYRVVEDQGEAIPKEPREMLQQYVSDMIAVDRQILETVVQELNDEDVTKYPAVKSVMEKIHKTLVDQIPELDKQLYTLGGEREGRIKDTVTKIVGQLAGVASRTRGSRVSKALRDDYGGLNMAAVGYEMLHTTALGLNEKETADIALRHLTNIAPIIVELNQVIPETVAKELQDEGKKVDPTVSREAVDNINSAWRVLSSLRLLGLSFHGMA